MGLLLGIDIGTTSTVATLIDPEGALLAVASRPAELRSPHAGWAEEDPEQWWRNVCELVPEVLAAAGRSAREIVAVGAAGMVPTIVLLDGEGAVLRPSIQQNDARAVAEIEELCRRFDEQQILDRTGSAITQQSLAPKLLWLRRHEPQVMNAARHLMGSYDFLVHRLTGSFSAERNWALESGLFDFRSERWIAGMLEAATIEESWLGTVRWPREVAGEVTVEAARATGLRAGTPVVAGSADHVASTFSAGVTEPGDLLVKLGGAGDILFCADRPLVDARLFLDYHLVDDRWLPNGCMAASGSLIKWFAHEFGCGAGYGDLDREAAALPPGAEGLVLLPYFLGEKTPINDARARGLFFGLTLSHRRGHLYRAVLEGIGFGFRHHLAVLEEKGLSVSRVRVTNGGARSALWKQITADVLGRTLQPLKAHPGSCLGAAFVAGMGTGVFARWEEIERFLAFDEPVVPDMRAHERYRSLYGIYRQLYDRNVDLMHALSGDGTE